MPIMATVKVAAVCTAYHDYANPPLPIPFFC